MDGLDWSFEVSIKVKGPTEGKQTILLSQEETTKAHALKVQKGLTLLAAAINAGDLKIEDLLSVITKQ